MIQVWTIACVYSYGLTWGEFTSHLMRARNKEATLNPFTGYNNERVYRAIGIFEQTCCDMTGVLNWQCRKLWKSNEAQGPFS